MPFNDDIFELWINDKITNAEYYAFVEKGIYPQIYQQALDAAQKITDKQLKKLENRIAKEYYYAAKDMRAKLKDERTWFEEQLKQLKALKDEGQLTAADITLWRSRHKAVQQHMDNMIDVLAYNQHNANKIAMQMARTSMLDAYAENFNFQTYMIEQQAKINTSFTVYSHETVERLMREDPNLLPPPKPGGKTSKLLQENPDLVYNKKKISSAVTQSILQGEGVEQLARRLDQVGEMNYHAAIRNARTMITGAQNAGRCDAAKRATDLGVELWKEWIATLDNRTRHAHRLLHGERVEVDEPFEVEGKQIMYPGDPDAAPELVWNCRCSIAHPVKGFEHEPVKTSPKMTQDYEDWKNEHSQKNFTASKKQSKIDDRFSDARKAAALDYAYRQDADKVIRPWLDDNWDDLEEYEKYAVHQYTHNSNPINKPLSGYELNWDRSSHVGLENARWGVEDRYRTFDTSEFKRKFGTDGHVDYKKTISKLTTAIDKMELPSDMFLYRGCGSSSIAGMFENGGFDFNDVKRILDSGDKNKISALFDSVKGIPLQEHAFMSTGIAEDAGFTHKDIVCKIYAPQGTHGVYAEPQSWYGDTVGRYERLYKVGESYTYVGSEAEIILQRGGFYEITDYEFKNGKLYLSMDCVEQPDYFKFGDENTYDFGETRHWG